MEKIQENIKLSLNTFENIMENGAFAPKDIVCMACLEVVWGEPYLGPIPGR